METLYSSGPVERSLCPRVLQSINRWLQRLPKDYPRAIAGRHSARSSARRPVQISGLAQGPSRQAVLHVEVLPIRAESGHPATHDIDHLQELPLANTVAKSRMAHSNLREELRATQEDLQSAVSQLKTSNEELRASHEETMSINEELQVDERGAGKVPKRNCSP